MARWRLFLLLAVGVLVGGCSAVSETWHDWFGEVPTPTPVPTPDAGAAPSEVFYAATDGLAMHALPSGSSDIVARLALHQRVTRTGIARGYANVTTDAGLQGWVDNAQLLWRLPAAPAPPTSAAAPSAGAGEAPAAETPAPPEPSPTDTPMPQSTTPGGAPAIIEM